MIRKELHTVRRPFFDCTSYRRPTAQTSTPLVDESLHLHAELTRVLAWACDAFSKGPLDEAYDWDYDLQLAEDSAAQGHIGFDESSRSLRVDVHPGVMPASRHTVTLTVSGTPVFCRALREAFGLDG